MPRIIKATKAQDIQRALSRDIVRGRMAPGSALDETVMAQKFGVSRTPIREAIRLLQVSGLVEVRPHRGAVVADIPQDRLDDMFAVMAEMESLCARWAALAMTGPERRALREIHEEAALLVKTNQRDLYVGANDRFHEAIYCGSHSAFLAETTRGVRARLAPFRRIQFEGGERLAKSYAEHEHVLAAIEAGDLAGAETAMRRHIGVVRSAVEIVMEPQGGTAPRPDGRRAVIVSVAAKALGKRCSIVCNTRLRRAPVGF